MPFVEQDNVARQTEVAENGPAFPGDTGAWIPYQYYPWDNSRYVGLGTLQPMFECPADSRTLQVEAVGGFQLQLTAYQGVLGVSHFGGKGIWDSTDTNTEVDPTTNLVTGQNGILITKQNATGIMPPGVRIADVTDGTSNTLMVGERPPSADMNYGWMFSGWGNTGDNECDVILGISERNATGPNGTINPNGLVDPTGTPCSPGSADPNSPLAYKFSPGDIHNQCDQFHYWSLHAGGGNFVFADGSVHFVTYGIEPRIQRALATRNGGEVAILP